MIDADARPGPREELESLLHRLTLPHVLEGDFDLALSEVIDVVGPLADSILTVYTSRSTR